MSRQHLGRVLGAGGILLAAACQDLSQPTDPALRPQLPLARQQPSPDDPVALARGVRGFGGFFLDADGAPTVYLTDPAERGTAEQALRPFLQARSLPSQLRVRQADFDYQRLEDWFASVSPEALAVSGAVFADLDEVRNRVRIGVAHGAAEAEVRQLVASLGVPAAALVVEQTSPIRQVAQLAQLDWRVRPASGGLQIDFILGVCSLGFNARRNGVLSFVTASHCTLTQGGIEGTPYFQETWLDFSGLGTMIGTEADDPLYFSSPRGKRRGACPRNRVCRYSDASRAQYSIPLDQVALGRIARTTEANTYSIAITGSFEIDPDTLVAEYGSANFPMNAEVNKVGRTTGWTRGPVSGTCVHVAVDGTAITQLCQTLVGSDLPGPVLVGAGDSGSPVFIVNGNGKVTLAGILWGGNLEGTLFAFSPLANIQMPQELGVLVVVP